MNNFLDIKSRSDLCNFLGITDKALRFYCYAKTSRIYKIGLIPKKSGELRTIYKPIKGLHLVQRKLKEEFDKLIYEDNFAYAFYKGKNIAQGASNHKKSKIVISFDLKDFFESIHIGRIIGLLEHKPFNFPNHVAVLIAQLVTADKKLIQGSCCSPVLSNMIFYNVDKEIRNYIKGKRIKYSRYADDLTFSFSTTEYINLFLKNDNTASNDFKLLIRKNGFQINDNKTHIRVAGLRQLVTGLVVNDIVNLKKDYRKNIKGFLHSLEKYGVDKTFDVFCKINGCEKNDKNKKFMLESYKGKINYLGMIRGKNNTEYIKYANTLNEFLTNKIKRLETEDLALIKKYSIFSVSGSNNDDSLGSAFAYNNYIITCEHVIHDYFPEACVGSLVTCYNCSTRAVIPCKIIRISFENDFAILKPVNNIELISIKPSRNNESFDNVVIAGYPDYNAASENFNNTIYGKYQTKQKFNNKTFYVFDASMQKGISGGAVLNGNNHIFAYAVYGSDTLGNSRINNGSLPITLIDESLDEINKDSVI